MPIQNRLRRFLRAAPVSASLVALPVVAHGGSHTWDVNEVFSDATGNVQFIELIEANGTPNEVGVPGHTMTSDLKIFVIEGEALASPTSSKTYLMGTEAFAALPGAPTPDAIIPAGVLPFFFSPNGDTVSYTPWDSFTFASAPTDGTTSLNQDGTTGPNSPKNYAGVSGSVDAAPALAITLGQVDDFQDGTTQNWEGGSNPTNVANGGPDGAGDRYLQVSANNFHLGARNQVQWAGDYLAEGVDELVVDLNNFGPNAVALRVSLSDGTTTFTSTNETVLAAGSGWVSASFSLIEAQLTRTQGTGALDQTLAGVTNLLLRHDPDPISPPGEANFVTATLGIDNVTALPEPRMSLLLAAGLPAVAALARLRARRAAGREIPARRERVPPPGQVAS